MHIPEKPVIVTGGASGIGRAISEYLASLGIQVGILDIDTASTTATLQSLEDAGTRGFGYEVDITRPDDVRDAVAQFIRDTGAPVYGLVNNAGWDRAMPFIDTTPAFRDQIINLNLHGPLNVTHAVLPSMTKAGCGRIISIASDAGRVGSTGEAVYSAAKGGIIAFMKTLAREHTRDGITCNSICPGPTQTPMFESFDESGRLAAALEKSIPMRRLARPDDFPALVSYFLSEEAAYVTGQTVSVSGGLTMS